MIVLEKENILLNQSYENAQAAIEAAGKLLLKNGYVDKGYIQSMQERQKNLSVYIGNFTALPHGKDDEFIKKDGIVLLQVPDGVDFGHENKRQLATIIFAVALKGEAQLTNLQELAFFCSDIEKVMALADAQSVEEVQEILQE